MPLTQRFSDLSAPRQALVRLCQSLDYGQIQDLAVQGGEPLFRPSPVVLVDIKLDGEDGPRREATLTDFVLRDQVCRFMAHLDELENGTIKRIEVRAGIPRRVIVERRLTEASL